MDLFGSDLDQSGSVRFQSVNCESVSQSAVCCAGPLPWRENRDVYPLPLHFTWFADAVFQNHQLPGEV